MDSSSADHLRQAIDDEIKSLEASLRALKSRRNALVPISHLPPEILAAIFLFLSPSVWNRGINLLEWLSVTHVCHRWRDIALAHPRLWSHINFISLRLTPAGMAGMLARAKMTPLHWKAEIDHWSTAKLEAFERQLKAHISHTSYLDITGDLTASPPLGQLVSTAPILELLALSHRPLLDSPIIMPDALVQDTAPRLTTIRLANYDISWKSPLLKGLRSLEINKLSTEARPKLQDWMDALNGMPHLQTLFLLSSSPIAYFDVPPTYEPQSTVTLPSLTQFCISGIAADCSLALAHLVLPALTSLRVDIQSHDWDGDDVRQVLPRVARNAHGPQDSEPLQSILISSERTRAEILAWTVPGADLKIQDRLAFLLAPGSARVVFSAWSVNWNVGTDTAIFDALLTHLPVASISTLTTQNYANLGKEVWLNHAPRLPSLERVRLSRSALRAFREMLESTPPDGPLLPLLTTLILVDVSLTVLKTYHIRDMLMERVGQGIPLETLDLRACIATDRAVQLLAEIVADVQGPSEAISTFDPAFIDWSREEVGSDDSDEGGYYDTDEYDDDEDEVESEYGQYSDDYEYYSDSYHDDF
ncbi:hypothetical protein BC826DRAFT_993688 [Russula brevipes]|nr:hypothetical protein BC826DRAFT_993688 [Russula brevipes]